MFCLCLLSLFLFFLWIAAYICPRLNGISSPRVFVCPSRRRRRRLYCCCRPHLAVVDRPRFYGTIADTPRSAARHHRCHGLMHPARTAIRSCRFDSLRFASIRCDSIRCGFDVDSSTLYTRNNTVRDITEATQFLLTVLVPATAKLLCAMSPKDLSVVSAATARGTRRYYCCVARLRWGWPVCSWQKTRLARLLL